MSHDSSVTNAYARDGQTADTSRSIGRQQAQAGGPSSAQQSGESAISFQTRQNEYNLTRSQQGKQGN